LKIANFPYTVTHLAPSIEVTPFELLETRKNPETRVFHGADSEDFMMFLSVV